MNKIKIILVDDHQVVRDGIIASLMLYPDIDVIADFSNGKDLLDNIESLSPDVVILDIAMPELSGIEICKLLKRDFPEIKVVIFTGDEEQETIFNALKAGANAFLPKDAQREELSKAIYKVRKGESYISSSISNTILIDYLKHEEKTDDEELSERELEILVLIAEGDNYKTIADKLNISSKTVEKHKRNILEKLNLETTIDIVKYAIKNKLIVI